MSTQSQPGYPDQPSQPGVSPTGPDPGRPVQPYPGQAQPAQPYPAQPAQPYPAPAQPYPGQPYPGQPYPGQPYPGQPYPGQPYPAQPYQPYPVQMEGFTVPAGYRAPAYTLAPYYLTKRIPDDQPYTLRTSVGKRVAQFGGLGLFVVLMLGCVSVGAIVEGGEVGVAVALGLVTLVLLAVLGLSVYGVTSGGPVLAVGPHGLWIKTRPTRGQAIWLPWETIELIDTRRWGVEKNLRVRPRDPRVSGSLGTFTAFDSAMQQLFFGTGFLATLSFSNQPSAQTFAAIRYFSAGRCHLRF